MCWINVLMYVFVKCDIMEMYIYRYRLRRRYIGIGWDVDI
jgi:hypothetical protein